MAKKTTKNTFRTALTGKVCALSVLPICAAGFLLFFALDAGKKFSENDPTRYPFVGIPAMVALILLATVLLTMKKFLGKEITLEEKYLIYKDHETELHLEIVKMAFTPPTSKGFFSTLMFSDGETFVQIPEIFMAGPDFETLCEEISKRRRRSRIEGSQHTYSL